ncbi:MAG: hypothetical protein KIT84_15330 [Labilithrix sp.]|nr:hypothetical protein [Labilithrix sp.]MCW5812397.1 hypothetical protein [Labilithrix sp.]
MSQAPRALHARAKMDSVDLWTDVARDLWQVELANGQVCAMSVDELDASFERGEIGLHTRVQRPSGGDWRTLAEAAGVDDSIRPVSSEIELVEIPRPPPLPRRILASEPDLTSAELALIPPPRRTGSRLAAVAVFGLLVGGLAAWRYMPAHPSPTIATTTIPAPTTPIAAAQPAEAETPAPAAAAPETTPAPEGNAISEPTATTEPKTAASKPLKKKKATPATKQKTTWKHRTKVRAGKKKQA